MCTKDTAKTEVARPNRLTVLLVERSDLLREGLSRLLGTIPGAEVAEAEQADDALLFLMRRHAEVVVVDIDLPGWTDLEDLARIRRAMGTATLIVIASDASPELITFCRGVGADFLFHTHSEFYRIGDVLLHLLTHLAEPSTEAAT